MAGRKKQSPPSFVKGRKGQTSVVDSIVALLWGAGLRGSNRRPSLSFAEMQEQVSEKQGYSVSDSTIRSTIYNHAELFERVVADDGGPLRWKLSDQAVRKAGEHPR